MTKRWIFILLLFTAENFSSCSLEKPAGFPSVTISQFLASTQYSQATNGNDGWALDSIAKCVTLFPELNTLLGNGTYTFFAPSNLALKNFMQSLGISSLQKINAQFLKDIISYHIVSGKFLESQIKNQASLTSLYVDEASGDSQVIEINSDGTLKTGSLNQKIAIGAADQVALNGAIQIIDDVLIPPSASSTFNPILGSIMSTLTYSKDFTDLLKMITVADLGFVEDSSASSYKIFTWLSMPIDGGWIEPHTANLLGETFFATSNSAFAKVAATSGKTEDQLIASLTVDSKTARNFLMNHLVTGFGEFTVSSLVGCFCRHTIFFDQESLTASSGNSITVKVGSPSLTIPFGVSILASGSSEIPIVKKDVVRYNGVIQVIDGYLN